MIDWLTDCGITQLHQTARLAGGAGAFVPLKFARRGRNRPRFRLQCAWCRAVLKRRVHCVSQRLSESTARSLVCRLCEQQYGKLVDRIDPEPRPCRTAPSILPTCQAKPYDSKMPNQQTRIVTTRHKTNILRILCAWAHLRYTVANRDKRVRVLWVDLRRRWAE